MSVAPAPYNISLSAASPLFQYSPSRDGDVLTAWNSSYTLSSVWPEGGAAISPPTDGIGFRRTQAGGARLALTFQGSALYLCFTAGGAGYALTLDNTLTKNSAINAATHPICSKYAAAGVDTLLAAEGLDPGATHTALLQVSASSTNEFRFFGGTVTMGVTTNGRTVDDTATVDDRDPAWAFTPNTGSSLWDRSHGGRTLYNTTHSFDCNYGATVLASYTFTGAGGAVLLGSVWPDAHAFSVTLDDKTTNMDAGSSWEDGQAVFFLASGLDPNAQHTITLRDFNSDVPDCNRGHVCCVGLDAIQLLKPGSSALPSGNPGKGNPAEDQAPKSSTNVGAIAGGVVAGVVGIIVAAVLVWYFCFRKRRGYERPSRTGNGVLAEDDPALVARPWAPTGTTPSAPSQWGAESHPGSAPFTTTSAASGVIRPSQEAQWNPAAAPVVPVIPPVVASGDRKNRSGFGAHSHAQSTSSQPQSIYPQSLYSGGPGSPGYAQSASNGSESNYAATSTHGGQARLAEEDLERVLAFVAQRMDVNRSQPNLAAPVAPAPVVDDHDHLPEYRA